MNVIPGEEIAVTTDYEAGQNCYMIGNNIYSAILGTSDTDNNTKKVNIIPEYNMLTYESGNTCICRVTYITRAQVEVIIVEIENQKVNNIEGIIRSEDKNAEKYSIGAYVLAKILTVSDRAYLLTTKEENLGIIQIEKFENDLMESSDATQNIMVNE